MDAETKDQIISEDQIMDAETEDQIIEYCKMKKKTEQIYASRKEMRTRQRTEWPNDTFWIKGG